MKKENQYLLKWAIMTGILAILINGIYELFFCNTLITDGWFWCRTLIIAGGGGYLGCQAGILGNSIAVDESA